MFIAEDYPLDYLYYLGPYVSGLKSSNSDYPTYVWVGTKYAFDFHVLTIQIHTTPVPGGFISTGVLGVSGKRQ